MCSQITDMMPNTSPRTIAFRKIANTLSLDWDARVTLSRVIGMPVRNSEIKEKIAASNITSSSDRFLISEPLMMEDKITVAIPGNRKIANCASNSTLGMFSFSPACFFR